MSEPKTYAVSIDGYIKYQEDLNNLEDAVAALKEENRELKEKLAKLEKEKDKGIK